MSAVPPIPPPPAFRPEPVPNHLVWSIVATIIGFCLCCPSMITGIVAIVFSARVNTLLTQGNIEGARRASASAKTWCWVTTALAIIGLILNIYYVATGGARAYIEMLQQFQAP